MWKRNFQRKTGLPPGSVIHTGERKTIQAVTSKITFNRDHIEENPTISTTESWDINADASAIHWFNVMGLHDTELLNQIASVFSIPLLIMEDVANTDQRPKLEVDEHVLFLTAKMIRVDPSLDNGIDLEQVSFLITDRTLLTFQEKPGDVFDAVRERLRKNKGRLRRNGPDYLAYSLIDTMVDHYFLVLDYVLDKGDDLEQDILENQNDDAVRQVHHLRSLLLTLRKAITPLRDMIGSLTREEDTILIHSSTLPYFRDVHDHILHILETIETQREVLSGLLEIHFSNLNKRMGDVMKVLTIIATLFIPLTFIVGIYGMNFEHMPELTWKWGYPAILLLMFTLSLVMLLYFKVKRWL